jgi:hypothetical protein
MNKSIERRRLPRSVATAVTICLLLAVLIMNAANQRAATDAGTGSSSATQDPPAAQVNAFKADAAPFKQGILQLVNMQDDMGKDWTPLCNAACIRTGLDHGAALAAIAKQKYPNIENPSWASNFEDKVGTWRHLAEDREKIVKAYLSDKVGALVKTKAKQLDKDRGNNLGIPSGLYRRGLVMYRKPGVEPCVVAKFSFEQNYVGGRYDAMAKTSGMTYLVRMQTCK